MLAVALAMLVNGLNYVWSDKRTRKFKRGRQVVFILSILFLFGSIAVTINDDFQTRLEKQDLTTRLDALSGGNNYCHVEFDIGSVNSEGSTPVLLHVINEGQYPAYDVV